MLFEFGLIGIIWIGGSGESMGKTSLFMGKGFHRKCGSGRFFWMDGGERRAGRVRMAWDGSGV